MSNPFPRLEQVMKVHAPAEVLVMDLDDPKVWTRPPISPHKKTAAHWGGSANRAGEPLEDMEEPATTWWQKVGVQFGRVKRVVRIWEHWHRFGRAMSAIAYCGGIDPIFGRFFRFRGFRHNGAQWGSINTITLSIVFILGLGQYPRRPAWKTLGLIWFFSDAVPVVGHRFFNDWPQTRSKTYCPGDRIAAGLKEGVYIDALGVLKRRKAGLSSRGRCVRAATLKLTELGYLDGMRSKYTLEVRAAVRVFRADEGLTVTGKIDRPCWIELAHAGAAS